MTIRGRLLKWLQAGDKKSYSADWLADKMGQYNQAEVINPMENHATVHAIVQVISQNLAAIPGLTLAGEDEVFDTPLQKLMKKPNPLESGYSLFEKTAMFMSLQGEAFWILTGSAGMQAGLSGALPAQIWAVAPSTMQEALDTHGQLVGWVYTANKKRTTFKPEEVLHFKRTNPYNPIRGLSPLSAARLDMDTDASAGEFVKRFYENNATPGGVVQVPGEPGVPVDEDLYKQMKAQFETRHKGVVNSHKVAILSEGVTFTPTMMSFIDQQFLESRKWNKDQLAMVWLVPRLIIGSTDELNFATAQVSRRQFYVDCLLPLAKLISIKINEDLYDRFQPKHQFSWNLDSIEELKPNAEIVSKLVTAYWNIGVPMVDLVEAYDLPFDPVWAEAESSMIPSKVKIAGAPEPEPVAPIVPPAPGEEEEIEDKATTKLLFSKLKRFFFEQRLQILKENTPEVWKKEEEKLLKRVTPIIKGLYREKPDLAEHHLDRIVALNTSMKGQVERAKSAREVKEIYTNASSKAWKIAEAEVQFAKETI